LSESVQKAITCGLKNKPLHRGIPVFLNVIDLAQPAIFRGSVK